MDALLQSAHASESKDLLLPAWATSSLFTTVAGQGWLVGLAEPALDAGTALAYRRVGRQGGIGNSDRDGLFEQKIGAQKHDRSSSGPRKAVSCCACLRAGTLGPQGCAPSALDHDLSPDVVGRGLGRAGAAWRNPPMMDRLRPRLLFMLKICSVIAACANCGRSTDTTSTSCRDPDCPQGRQNGSTAATAAARRSRPAPLGIRAHDKAFVTIGANDPRCLGR
jgi:hypothetical protein